MNPQARPVRLQALALTILAFGDSNTWGFDAKTASRLPREQRWPRVAEAALHHPSYVVEEGLNGRTCATDDPDNVGRNGLTYFIPCLASHQPLQGVTIMLGTNDLKDRFGLTAEEIATRLGQLVDAVSTVDSGGGGASPRCLIIAPPRLQATGPFAKQFSAGIETSVRLAPALQEIASTKGVDFLDSSDYCSTSSLDGIHLDASGHAALGAAVAQVWRRWTA